MNESNQVQNGESPDGAASKMDKAEMQSELRVLRNQVDLLQVQTFKMLRSRLSWATTLISFIAIVVSGGTAVYTLMREEAQEVRSKKEELRKLITGLVELREEFRNRVSPLRNPEMRRAVSRLLDTKRMVFLESAELLATQIPDRVNSSEYLVLAEENVFITNYAQAERYYKKAVDTSRTALSKAVTIREMARFHFSEGPFRDFEKGRKYFAKAVELLRNPVDDYTIYHLGSTYEQWGLAELWSGFETEGHQRIALARKHYMDLSSNFPGRMMVFQLMEKKVKQVGKTKR